MLLVKHSSPQLFQAKREFHWWLFSERDAGGAFYNDSNPGSACATSDAEASARRSLSQLGLDGEVPSDQPRKTRAELRHFTGHTVRGYSALPPRQ